LIYSQQEKTIRKEKRANRTSLSDYFSKSQKNSQDGEGFNSMMAPMLSEMNVKVTPLKSSFCDVQMADQEDEMNYILDIDMMYGKEVESKIPSIGKQERE
jgi:hypothetical protein